MSASCSKNPIPAGTRCVPRNLEAAIETATANAVSAIAAALVRACGGCIRAWSLSVTPILVLAFLASACGPSAEHVQIQNTTEADETRTVVISAPRGGMDADSVRSELESIDRAARQIGLMDRSTRVTAPDNVHEIGPAGRARSVAAIASAMGIGEQAGDESPNTPGKGGFASSTVTTTSAAATVTAVDHIAAAAGLPANAVPGPDQPTPEDEKDSRTAAARQSDPAVSAGGATSRLADEDTLANESTPRRSGDVADRDETSPSDSPAPPHGGSSGQSAGAESETTGSDTQPERDVPNARSKSGDAVGTGRADDGVVPDSGRQSETRDPATRGNAAGNDDERSDDGAMGGDDTPGDRGRDASSPGGQAGHNRDTRERHDDHETDDGQSAGADADAAGDEADEGSTQTDSNSESGPTSDGGSTDVESDDAPAPGGRAKQGGPSGKSDHAHSPDDGKADRGDSDDDGDGEPFVPAAEAGGNGADHENRGAGNRGGGRRK